MDDWGFEQLDPWLRARETMPVGPLFCVINGRTRGGPCGMRRPHARRCADAPPEPARVDASPPTNCGTRTRSSYCAKACR
jgi:hypothetical protein